MARFSAGWKWRPIVADEEGDRLTAALEEELAVLDEEETALLEARYFSSDTLETIAARHGLTTRAVEGRLARLRKRLRHSIPENLQKKK